MIKLWSTGEQNVLTRQDSRSPAAAAHFVLSEVEKLYSESKKAEILYPEEIRSSTSREGDSTLILIKAVDPQAAHAELFRGLSRESVSMRSS